MRIFTAQCVVPRCDCHCIAALYMAEQFYIKIGGEHKFRQANDINLFNLLHISTRIFF